MGNYSEETKRHIEVYLRTIITNESLRKLKEALTHNDYRESTEVKRLFKHIAEICQDSDKRFITELHEGTVLYRARQINSIGDVRIKEKGININEDGSTKGYDDVNSREAPITIPSGGRTNIRGVSYFYGSDSEATACAELKLISRCVISLAEFVVLKDISILDLTNEKLFSCEEINEEGIDLNIYWADLMSVFQTPVTEENEYLITQVISEEFRKQGIDGIKYSSFLGEGKNYTVFSCGTNYLGFVNSRIITLMGSNQVFWDYNNKCSFQSFPNSMKLEYNKEVANNHLQQITESWK